MSLSAQIPADFQPIAFRKILKQMDLQGQEKM
jgi:hypothetical protein